MQSDEEENWALLKAKQMADAAPSLWGDDDVSSSNTGSVYIGVSYFKIYDGADYGTNHFALIASSSPTSNTTTAAAATTVWNYRKAHPVPLVESNVKAGPAKIPVYNTADYGKLAGAICFDMDYAQYIVQAGRAGVNIMLQPSWTWNAINYRHFDGNALRAVENGFTLFRCSSDGESGIVSPHGKVLSRTYTGHDPVTSTATFTLPLYHHNKDDFNNKNTKSHVHTLFATAGGFIFEYVCLAFAVLYIIAAVVPKSTLRSVLTIRMFIPTRLIDMVFPE